MFCPRCGSPNPETTKFCRQCGLGLQAVTGYVAGGGTAQLPPSPATSANPIAKITEGLPPKQKMILAILAMVLSPAIFGTLGLGWLSGISAILMPLGIVFVVMWYKAQERRLQEAMQQRMYPPMPPYQMPVQMPPPTSYGLPPTGQPTVPHTYQPPVYHQPAPPPTNPLTPGSIVEDETRRLPDQR